MKQPDATDFDQHLASYKEDFTPDVFRGLERLRARVDTKSTDVSRPATVRRLSRPSLLSAAAAVLLLLAGAYLALAGNGNTVLLNDTDAPLARVLPDGTRVLLQQEAELTYGKSFNEFDRLIDLKGQAYFEVHKDADRPFLVNTSETELRVTGTAFNLRVNGDEMEVEVSEGAVQLSRKDQVLEVKARHCGLALPGKKCSLMDAANLNRHAWRTGTLRFQGALLPDVVKTIGNNYGYKIDLAGDCNFPVSGTFATDDPVGVLETLAALGGGQLVVHPGQAKSFALKGVCEKE